MFFIKKRLIVFKFKILRDKCHLLRKLVMTNTLFSKNYKNEVFYSFNFSSGWLDENIIYPYLFVSLTIFCL